MSFAWPFGLLSLLAIPLLLGAYVLLRRRKRRHAVRVSNVALIKAAMPKRSRWRRYLPLALFMFALSSLGVGSARPSMAVTVPLSRTTVVLALDVSRSMCATDVLPNRLAVAQNAARSFVEKQAGGTRIGIVAFSGFAEVLVPPTTDRDALLAAIDGLTTARGTAIGSATMKALDAIAAVNPDVAPSGIEVLPSNSGEYVPDIVVLLTDGANTRGIKPLEAAEQAVLRRVRVFTIGFGTTQPSGMVCTREQLGGDALGGNGGFGGGAGGTGGAGGGLRQALIADNDTLTKVAELTGGEFYKAENADQLTKVFEALPSRVELQTKQREISVVFALLGVMLAGAAITLSLLWNRFP